MKNISGQEFTTQNDLSREASDYVQDVTAQNQQQGRNVQQLGRGRQYADFNVGNDIGGTQQLKPITPDYAGRHYDELAHPARQME